MLFLLPVCIVLLGDAAFGVSNDDLRELFENTHSGTVLTSPKITVDEKGQGPSLEDLRELFEKGHLEPGEQKKISDDVLAEPKNSDSEDDEQKKKLKDSGDKEDRKKINPKPNPDPDPQPPVPNPDPQPPVPNPDPEPKPGKPAPLPPGPKDDSGGKGPSSGSKVSEADSKFKELPLTVRERRRLNRQDRIDSSLKKLTG